MKTRMNNKMKKSLAVLVASLAIYVTAFAGTPLGEFKMLKTRNGIDLYYRWMRMSEDNKVRQMKAVVEFSGEARDVLDLLQDESRALNWVPSAEQFRNLTPVNSPEWASYIQFAIPWPFADQDCILEFKESKGPEGETILDFHTNPDYLEKYEDISRMKDITGSFVIRTLPDGRSVLECYFVSEKASVIPRWITEPIITGSILSLMEALRTQLTEV
ncbi:MAG: hypothetical protein MUC31_00410 [Bacteroidales bacterium]|jgi:hypothetical protein|nr:hypothetical protein [Bacteroidales bacterium]